MAGSCHLDLKLASSTISPWPHGILNGRGSARLGLGRRILAAHHGRVRTGIWVEGHRLAIQYPRRQLQRIDLFHTAKIEPIAPFLVAVIGINAAGPAE